MPSAERQDVGSATGAAPVTAAVAASAQQKQLPMAVEPRAKKPVLLQMVVDALSRIPLLFHLPLMLSPAVNSLRKVCLHPLLRLLFALAAASSDASQLRKLCFKSCFLHSMLMRLFIPFAVSLLLFVPPSLVDLHFQPFLFEVLLPSSQQQWYSSKISDAFHGESQPLNSTPGPLTLCPNPQTLNPKPQSETATPR